MTAAPTNARLVLDLLKEAQRLSPYDRLCLIEHIVDLPRTVPQCTEAARATPAAKRYSVEADQSAETIAIWIEMNVDDVLANPHQVSVPVRHRLIAAAASLRLVIRAVTAGEAEQPEGQVIAFPR